MQVNQAVAKEIDEFIILLSKKSAFPMNQIRDRQHEIMNYAIELGYVEVNGRFCQISAKGTNIIEFGGLEKKFLADIEEQKKEEEFRELNLSRLRSEVKGLDKRIKLQEEFWDSTKKRNIEQIPTLWMAVVIQFIVLIFLVVSTLSQC